MLRLVSVSHIGASQVGSGKCTDGEIVSATWYGGVHGRVGRCVTICCRKKTQREILPPEKLSCGE